MQQWSNSSRPWQGMVNEKSDLLHPNIGYNLAAVTFITDGPGPISMAISLKIYSRSFVCKWMSIFSGNASCSCGQEKGKGLYINI
jgi:hypothetical protein